MLTGGSDRRADSEVGQSDPYTLVGENYSLFVFLDSAGAKPIQPCNNSTTQFHPKPWLLYFCLFVLGTMSL